MRFGPIEAPIAILRASGGDIASRREIKEVRVVGRVARGYGSVVSRVIGIDRYFEQPRDALKS